MADLSAYIDFSVTIDNAMGTITLRDTSTYPAAVDQGIRGWFDITQPDGVTISGSALTPQVVWNGQLTHAYVGLRRAVDGCLQNGTYIFRYNVRHPSYDDTVVTKTAVVSIPKVVSKIESIFDVFTPLLKAKDSTVYAVPGFAETVVHNWSYDIVGVQEGIEVFNAPAEITLSPDGNFYEAFYNIEHVASVEYAPDAYSWVTIEDEYITRLSTYAQDPGDVQGLVDRLACMQAKASESSSSCEPANGAKAAYAYAQSLYSTLVEMIKLGDSAASGVYKDFLAATAQCGGTSSFTPSLQPIPPFIIDNLLTIESNVDMENVGGFTPVYRGSSGVDPKMFSLRTLKGNGLLTTTLSGDYIDFAYANKEIFNSGVDVQRAFPAGTFIEYIIVAPQGTIDQFRIGTSDGAEDIAFEQPVVGGSSQTFMVFRYFPAGVTLFFSGVTAATDFIVFKETTI